MDKKFPSEELDKFMLRLDPLLKQAIQVTAARNRRSMNSEIVLHLEAAFGEAMREEAGRKGVAA